MEPTIGVILFNNITVASIGICLILVIPKNDSEGNDRLIGAFILLFILLIVYIIASANVIGIPKEVITPR
jgi:hypothetical protein